jgi:glutaredoxin-like protein NrdH
VTVACAVFLYALSTCPWCRKAKQWFADNKVPFDYVDVDLLPADEQDDAAEKAFELSGARRFPVVVINGEVVAGYNPDRYLELLKSGGR